MKEKLNFWLSKKLKQVGVIFLIFSDWQEDEEALYERTAVCYRLLRYYSRGP